MKNFLLLFFVSTMVIGAGIPWKQQTDFGQLGRAGSVDPVEFFFDVGDGASNPKFSVDKTTKDFVFSTPVTIGATSFTVGDGTAADQTIIVDKGAGASNPKILWKESESRWKNFDGTTERPFGVGGGGADAINILSDSNPNAEDGVLNWTFVGTGAFATTSTNSFIYEGDKSFTVDFDVQAEILKSSEITIKQGLYGQSCQARFFYIGGDDSIDITATVRDGNDAIVSGSQTKVLKAATIWTVIDLGFVCPSGAEIGVDAQLANMYLQFEQTTAGNSTDFRFDQVHLGGLIGLTTATLPDLGAARIAVSGSAVITSKSSDLIASVGYNSAGSTTINFAPGLTVAPSITVTQEDNTAIVNVTNITTTSADILTEIAATGADFDSDYNVFVKKQDVDAKQSALVYESIPRVSENTNELSASISGSGVVTNENTDWISGNCSDPGSGTHTCTYNAEIFSVAPNCSVTAHTGANGYGGKVSAVSSTVLTTQTYNDAGVGSGVPHFVICTKQGADFKLPEKQLILVNGVETSHKAGLKTEACTINNNGTATIDSTSKLCESWVDSTTRTGAGIVDVNFTSFLNEPVCTCNVVNTDGFNCNINSMTSTKAEIYIEISTSGAQTDRDFTLHCMGAR